MALNRIQLIDVFEPLLTDIGNLEHSDKARKEIIRIVTEQLNAKFEPDGSSYVVDCLPPQEDNETASKFKYITITDSGNNTTYDITIGIGFFHINRSAVEDHTIDTLKSEGKI